MLEITKELRAAGNPEKAEVYSRFFKTGKGEYGEGDVFLGITVPEQRRLARKYFDISLGDVRELLYSAYHEHRLTGLLILVYKYERTDEKGKQKIVDFYLKHRNRGNNWDLIDCIADKLLGNHLMHRDKSILYEMAKSDNLWDRRISIISTFEFIRHGNFDDTLRIAEILLDDEHDLIHKAVGWMLRELGKRNTELLEKFLVKHSRRMPRTMLRYAVERLPERKRKFYMRRS
ncbi:MAG: DNA alkylation repair protein [Candidatus Aenigmarchaeota archaeon]|nr:DNA alkylation repair protein [Candidatus Aenigmarchaeota archaeon]